MSITNEDKFNLHFLKPKLKTNEKKNPNLVDLQSSYYTCNQKLNDFNQNYKTKYNDLFNILSQHPIDNDLVMVSINRFNKFVNDSQEDIKNCYNSILGKQKELMNSENADGSSMNSIIKNIQDETNEKYKQYQHDIIVLNRHQNELRKTINQYNSLETSLNDGLLTQTYTLFYIWFIILVIVVLCCFINMLNMNFGVVNNILLIFTVCVAMYFVQSNLKIYFV